MPHGFNDRLVSGYSEQIDSTVSAGGSRTDLCAASHTISYPHSYFSRDSASDSPLSLYSA